MAAGEEGLLYLENLDECVNDEDKIVTYSWLSRTLQVHVNQAKQMLYSFVQQQRNKGSRADALHVTYFVSGCHKASDDTRVQSCTVVPEEHLEAVKSSLEKIISCHIYSVQKAKLKNSNALYMSDYEKLKEEKEIGDPNRFSAIRCTKAKLRSNEELETLRNILSPQKQKLTNGETLTKAAARQQNPVERSLGKRAGSIAGMFANAKQKCTDNSKKEETDAAVKKEQLDNIHHDSSKPVEKGILRHFFAKKTDALKSELSKGPDVKTETKTATTAAERKEVTLKEREKKKNSRRLDSGNGSAPKRKRHRRIKDDLSDSSSSSSDEIEYEEPVPSPAREPSPRPAEVEQHKHDAAPEHEMESENVQYSERKSGERKRKRRRKLVPKVSLDEDGYMVTEKVWEVESTDASEPEEPVKIPVQEAEPVKQQAEKEKTKKPVPKGNAKQQMSLMSFFVKK